MGIMYLSNKKMESECVVAQQAVPAEDVLLESFCCQGSTNTQGAGYSVFVLLAVIDTVTSTFGASVSTCDNSFSTHMSLGTSFSVWSYLTIAK